jgi:hypothetical protein
MRIALKVAGVKSQSRARSWGSISGDHFAGSRVGALIDLEQTTTPAGQGGCLTLATVNVVVPDQCVPRRLGPYLRGSSWKWRNRDGEDTGRLPGSPRIEDRVNESDFMDLDQKVAQRRDREEAETHAGTLPWYRRILRGGRSGSR